MSARSLIENEEAAHRLRLKRDIIEDMYAEEDVFFAGSIQRFEARVSRAADIAVWFMEQTGRELGINLMDIAGYSGSVCPEKFWLEYIVTQDGEEHKTAVSRELTNGPDEFDYSDEYEDA